MNDTRNCTNCGGTGKKNCFYCHGSGMSFISLGLKLGPFCAHCIGHMGKVNCTSCNGTGKVKA